MKRLFLGLITATMLMACNQQGKTGNNSAGTSAAAPASAPVMKFEKETYDFGKINSGEKVHYDFKFTNIGKSPLIITDAVATCGCTKPEWPQKPVQPGESSAIKVTFNSDGKSGLQDKQITITANTVPAQNLVHLIGEVVAKK